MIEQYIIAENERVRLEDENARLRAELASMKARIAKEREYIISGYMQEFDFTKEQATALAIEEDWVIWEALNRIEFGERCKEVCPN